MSSAEVTGAYCTQCGFGNQAQARFCAKCGSALDSRVRGSAPGGSLGPPPAKGPQTVQTTPSAMPRGPGAILDLPYADFWVRLGAWFLDLLVALGILVALVLWDNVTGISNRDDALDVAQGALLVLLPLLYNWLFIGLRGQTLGKMALGIRVVDGNGGVPGLGRAVLREVPGKFLSALVFFLGFLWVLWDPQKQAGHDKMAGTYVVRRMRP